MQQFYSFKSVYIFFFLLFSVVTNAEIVLVSWNIKDFGKSRNDEEITAIAKHIRHADIFAIQEVTINPVYTHLGYLYKKDSFSSNGNFSILYNADKLFNFTNFTKY